jgi:hypothetical protein
LIKYFAAEHRLKCDRNLSLFKAVEQVPLVVFSIGTVFNSDTGLLVEGQYTIEVATSDALSEHQNLVWIFAAENRS